MDNYNFHLNTKYIHIQAQGKINSRIEPYTRYKQKWRRDNHKKNVDNKKIKFSESKETAIIDINPNKKALGQKIWAKLIKVIIIKK